jgi:hypothetical protein
MSPGIDAGRSTDHIRAMTSDWAKPRTGEHIFVILRRDAFVDDPLDAITGTKGYHTQEAAEAEADRLNAMNTDMDARYFVRLVRLQEF